MEGGGSRKRRVAELKDDDGERRGAQARSSGYHCARGLASAAAPIMVLALMPPSLHLRLLVTPAITSRQPISSIHTSSCWSWVGFMGPSAGRALTIATALSNADIVV